MAIAEITVVPVGVGTSLSNYVAACIRIIDESRLKYYLTPTSTVVEGNLDELVSLIRKVHEEPFKSGAKRVLTLVKIDDRRDKPSTMDSKLESIKEKINL